MARPLSSASPTNWVWIGTATLERERLGLMSSLQLKLIMKEPEAGGCLLSHWMLLGGRSSFGRSWQQISKSSKGMCFLRVHLKIDFLGETICVLLTSAHNAKLFSKAVVLLTALREFLAASFLC